MIRDLISNTKSKKEFDKLFKIAGSRVLANLNKGNRKINEKYISILENLNYDMYLRLPKELQEIVSKELNVLIRNYRDFDFNRSLSILKEENNSSIRNIDDLLEVAKIIDNNTNNIKNEGKKKLKSMKKLPKKLYSGLNKVNNGISLGYKGFRKILGMTSGALIMLVPNGISSFFGSLVTVPSQVYWLFGSIGGFVVLNNGLKLVNLIKGKENTNAQKTITVKGKPFKIAKTRRIKKEKSINQNLEQEDIFLENQPIFENTESVFLDQNIESCQNDIPITDESKKVYESLLTLNKEEVKKEEEKVYDSLLTSKGKEENTNLTDSEKTTEKSVQNLEESKSELEKYRKLVTKVKDLNDSLTRSLNFFKSDLLMITYQNNGLSHGELYKTVPLYHKRYLQKNKCERALKECETILRFISKIITPTTDEKSLSDGDIELLNYMSEKFVQVENKSRKI